VKSLIHVYVEPATDRVRRITHQVRVAYIFRRPLLACLAPPDMSTQRPLAEDFVAKVVDEIGNE